jgi:hypothetical protein
VYLNFDNFVEVVRGELALVRLVGGLAVHLQLLQQLYFLFSEIMLSFI